MKKLLIFIMGIIPLLTFPQTVALNPAREIEATVHVQARGDAIDPRMFGMFIEHLGNVDVGDLMDDGLWAEVLDDRKFFYPVDTATDQQPGNFRDHPERWYPLGDPSTVRMDATDPYVGDHAPLITSHPDMENGIYQSGLWLRDVAYEGRIVLKADPGVTIRVRLRSGSNVSMDIIPDVSAHWKTFFFTLKLPSGEMPATFMVTGEGEGSFSVAAVSLMPEDNVNGFRADVMKLLHDLNSGIYRWGGNMSSGYDFRDGIGDPDKRPPRYDYAWNALENNDVGPDELVAMAEIVGVELSMTVNGGLGGQYSAAAFVEYMNGDSTTSMGKRRANNGHPEPYGIHYWCVGNESYGWWQLGHTALPYHVIKHNQFAEKMKQVDPSIELIASGASLEEMTVTGNALRVTGKVLAEYDSPADWTGGMLRGAAGNIDMMSEHFYCGVDERFDIDSGRYIHVDEDLGEWTRRPANRVKAKAMHYAHYRDQIPGADTIPVYLDEWAYYTNWIHPTPTLGVTIGYARALNEMFRHTDLFSMAGMTFCTSCLSFDDREAVYNTTGLLYRLYTAELGSIPVEVTGNSPQPAPQWPVGGGQPPVNAGSDTWPLDVLATIRNGDTLVVSVVNPTESAQSITLNIKDVKHSTPSTMTILSGAADSRNVVRQEPEVGMVILPLKSNRKITIPPVSVNVLTFVLKR